MDGLYGGFLVRFKTVSNKATTITKNKFTFRTDFFKPNFLMPEYF